MTRASHQAPLHFDDVEEVFDVLRESGRRLSAARRLVLTALFSAEGPVSAEEIAGGLGGRMGESDLTSVYRNLERLETLGIVRHVHFGHGPGLYALAGSGPREYIACERCERVTPVDPGELDDVRDLIRNRFGYEARFGHFPILGLCPDCAGQA